MSTTNQEISKYFILGFPIHYLQDYKGWIIERINQGRGLQIVTLNSEMVMQGAKNPTLAKVLCTSDLVIPDGAGVVWSLRLLYNKRISRMPGIELAESLLTNHNQIKNFNGVFFYGGSPGIAQKAALYWQNKNPNLIISGVEHGYLTEEQANNLTSQLRTIQPSIILVALGVPRQEIWIAEHTHLCPHAVWIGVGGSLDIWAGIKSRAPLWWRRNNLEWLYRLYQEPYRWRRMLALPHFAFKVLLNAILGKK